ncbi:17393_t:CDS:2 [Racocetra persica]|uniref:17393_t:CDS:1 n=1 Tax=Racocetra persica TaxID=160502 RepID=A0ACA9MJW6_9GLOM|nr:17393_t:CDS:2 [Racocetra persica]
MPKHTDHKKQIPKIRERYTICDYCKAKDLLCDNKISCSFCKLSNKTCKKNYRTSNKTKVLRKIFDAKINLLHTIEEAKLIFESLEKKHDFDKLYKILDNLQDTSDEENEYPNISQQQPEEYTPHYTPSMPFHLYIRQLFYQVEQCLTYNNLKELIEVITNDNQQLEEKNILIFEQQIEQLEQTKEKYFQDYDTAEKQREFL